MAALQEFAAAVQGREAYAEEVWNHLEACFPSSKSQTQLCACRPGMQAQWLDLQVSCQIGQVSNQAGFALA